MSDTRQHQAAVYVDARFQDQQHNLVLEHRRQEQRHLAFHKSQLQSFARNREDAEQRYVQRLRSIDEKRDRIAESLHRQHNSIGGRLAALTKAGRARQAEQLERLEDRALTLIGRATRLHAGLQERQFQAEQRDRISRAREMKFFREDHLQERRQQAQRHEQTRPAQIESHSQNLKRAAAEQAWEQQVHKQDQGRTRTR